MVKEKQKIEVSQGTIERLGKIVEVMKQVNEELDLGNILKFIKVIVLTPNQNSKIISQSASESYSKSVQLTPQTKKNFTFNYTPQIPKSENFNSSKKYESPYSTLERRETIPSFSPTPITPPLRQNNFANILPPKTVKKSKSRSKKRKLSSRSNSVKKQIPETPENTHKVPYVAGNLLQPGSYQDNIWRVDL